MECGDDWYGGRDLTELLKEVCEQLESVYAYRGSLTLMNMLRGHKGDDTLPCLDSEAMVGIHPCISLIMLACLNIFCCLRKLSNELVLTCFSFAAEKLWFWNIYLAVCSYPNTSDRQVDKFPTNLWCSGWTAYTAHFSAGVTSGELLDGLPVDHSWFAILSTHML